MNLKNEKEIQDYVLKNGKEYSPRVLPKDIRRGPVCHCFDNCALVALYNKKYKYVEGYATNPITKEWMAHAWLTDGENAYDPTWLGFDDFGREVPMPSRYVGIEMPIKNVVKIMLKTERAGVLVNAWRVPELAELVPLVI